MTSRASKYITSIFCYGFFLLGLCCCASQGYEDDQVVYWSANNPEEVSFAKRKIDTWNDLHPDRQIIFQTIPEGQSSEEIILAAVVGRTTPDIYANMWQGDVEDYARAGVLIALDTLDEFLSFLYDRCDSSVVDEVTSEDGHIYQIPWKANPIMMLYNPQLFKSVGTDQPPEHYDGFLELADKITDDRDGDGYKDRWMGTTEVAPIWWQRFFNFLPLYLAASGGAPLVKNGKATFDNEHGVAVFNFLQIIYRHGYFPREQSKSKRDPFLTSDIAVKFTGPWDIMQIQRFAPEELTYKYTSMPVPEYVQGPKYTYCDPKNIVIFNSCPDPQGAWKFLKTMMTDSADLEFLVQSRQLPRRKDLMNNKLFADFFDAHPELKPFQEQSQYLRGIDTSPHMKEVLDLISQEYELCVVYDRKSAEEAIGDAAAAVNLLYYK